MMYMVLYLKERDIKMRKFKKTVLFICMFLLFAALCACNKQDGGNNTDNDEINESLNGGGSYSQDDEPDIDIIPTGTFDDEPDETTPEETTPAPSSDDTFNYRVEDEVVVIVGLAEGVNVEEIIFPTTIEDKPVVKIADEAFRHNTLLKSIVLSEGLIEIGARAFDDCTSLEMVEMPATLEVIGNGAFSKCTLLAEITFGDGVVSLGTSAFADCSALEQVYLNKGLTSVGAYAFARCIALEAISLPDTVSSLGSCAFYHCEALKDVTVSDKITALEFGTFMYCKLLQKISLPDSVETIGHKVFAECINLKEVYIADAVSFMEKDIFEACTLVTLMTPDEAYAASWAKEHNVKQRAYY